MYLVKNSYNTNDRHVSPSNALSTSAIFARNIRLPVTLRIIVDISLNI